MVKQFHFIHFLDPEYHLRLRFLLSEPDEAGILLHQIQSSCKELLVEDLIWKIEVGTYEPEYERYGFDRLAIVESWFEIDSLYWLEEISCLSRESDADIWKSAVRSIDALLNDFGVKIDDKIKIINGLKEFTADLFSLNRSMKGQLDEKYRKMSGLLKSVMDSGTEGMSVYLLKRSEEAVEIVKQLRATFIDDQQFFESKVIPDLIHISLNRGFRTRHRLQELVVYDFMGRHYESARARSKNVKREA